jgi:hypothetical protein
MMNSGLARDGILSHLWLKHGGHIPENGIGTITSSSVVDNHPGSSPNNLADPQIRTPFFSKDEINQWAN